MAGVSKRQCQRTRLSEAADLCCVLADSYGVPQAQPLREMAAFVVAVLPAAR